MKRRLSMETLDNRRLLTSLVGADAGESGFDDCQSFRQLEPLAEEVSPLETADSGEVIPKLEIEQTANYGGSRATYLKYELTNVQVTAFDVNASGNDESPPTVTIANNFEEYKVTYTEYDSEGNKGGNAETTWKVEKGEK
jgi:hypothetical protein